MKRRRARASKMKSTETPSTVPENSSTDLVETESEITAAIAAVLAGEKLPEGMTPEAAVTELLMLADVEEEAAREAARLVVHNGQI